jgi:glycosyltransferase involved in cell wall biosynthesis
MENADVLLMTSLTEAAPLVILEAFSFSKPVIAYDCPVGPREIITDNVNGFLVHDGDKLQFVNKLKELLRSHILYNDLAEKAGIYAKHNSSENNYKLWLRLFC